MKLTIPHYLFFVSILLIVSCGTHSQESTTEDSTYASADSLTNKETEELITSLKEIITLLPEATFPISYTEEKNDFNKYGMNFGPENGIHRSCIALQGMLPETLRCGKGVYFTWKSSFNGFTLIDFVTVDTNAKGECILHHLATVNEEGVIIDTKAEWAGVYAIAVENPNGEGTSTGVEYTSGTVEADPVTRISSYSLDGDGDVVEISPDGHFVEPGQLFLNAETDLMGDTTDLH